MITSVLGVLFDGFAYGMLLFLLSVGLSVTLGMMNFVNLAHCTFGMIGGYVTVTLMNSWGWPFLATLPVAFVVAAAISVVFVSVATMAYVWGTIQQPVSLPGYLRGSIHIGGVTLGVYRIFLIGFALVITAALV